MRRGQNPAKSIEYVAQPEKVTVAVVTYIPFLSGYYAKSLDVLKVCLASILNHTDQPFDLMVFDNASCSEATQYLSQMHAAQKIQYLVFSDSNIGKVGAWNFIFSAAPGEYIVYSDSDVYYYPGWLPKHLEVFAAFPEAGTVTGLPRRGRRTFYTGTIDQLSSLPDAQFEEGKFIPDQWILDHARSLGKMDTIQDDLDKIDYRVRRDGVQAYATATHFQFMVRAKTVKDYLPFRSDRPMGDSVAQFDHAINDNKLLRLATADRVVQHLGNTIDQTLFNNLPPGMNLVLEAGAISNLDNSSSSQSRFFQLKPVKWLLHRIYDWIFRLYYW
jgi:glycosyltransferase involved in cell wall biosynthesis